MSDPNTAPKGINREALSRLDSEVEEWNRRRAEREATAAVKFDDETESKLAVCPPDLAAALRSFGATLKAAAAEERAEPEPPKAEQKGQLVLFPQWADTRRAAAQAVFRSALFPAMNNKQSRCYLEQERIASVDGVTVFFTGKQFDQSDLDVYLELLQVAHVTPFGVECTFTAYGLLKALGRATGNKDHKRLHSELNGTNFSCNFLILISIYAII